MDKQVFWIILLLDVYCVYNVENMDNKLKQPKSQMSKERARETCAQSGGNLVSYKTVKANPTAPAYSNQLVDGESAWIKGYAKLSPFLTWHACVNWTYMKQHITVHTVTIENKSLYLCPQSCLQYIINSQTYIGIKNRSCYCYHKGQVSAIRTAAVADSLCSLTCENNIVDSCGGHSFVSVYRIIPTRNMRWAQNEPSKRQCVYAKKRKEDLELYTASCHTLQSLNINGYICMNSESGSTVTSTCPTGGKTGVFCIVDIPSSRQEAFTSCLDRRGKLADRRSDRPVLQKVKTNFKYWISVYRTFGISEKYIENETICLAAVRVNDTLYLEPDDCSEQKHYLCEQNTVTDSSHYPDITSNTNPITPPLTKPNTGPITTDTKSNTGSVITVRTTLAISVTTKTPDNGNVSPFAYIIPSILLVAFLVILVVLVLYRRRKKRIRQNNFTPDDAYTAIYETDNLENGQTVSAVSSIQGRNVASKRLAAESTPNKPVRQTQRVKTEALGDKRKKTGKEMQTEDYDKIAFKQPVNVRKDAYEETNIYNHVLDTTDNNYDSTKAIKLFQSVGPCESDDTYSHMKGDVSTGDYCDLSVPGKKQNDRGKGTAVNDSYSKNVGQKDSSLSTDKHSRFVIVDDDSQDDMKNDDDDEEPTHPDETVTYTKISKVSTKN